MAPPSGSSLLRSSRPLAPPTLVEGVGCVCVVGRLAVWCARGGQIGSLTADGSGRAQTEASFNLQPVSLILSPNPSAHRPAPASATAPHGCAPPDVYRQQHKCTGLPPKRTPAPPHAPQTGSSHNNAAPDSALVYNYSYPVHTSSYPCLQAGGRLQQPRPGQPRHAVALQLRPGPLTSQRIHVGTQGQLPWSWGEDTVWKDGVEGCGQGVEGCGQGGLRVPRDSAPGWKPTRSRAVCVGCVCVGCMCGRGGGGGGGGGNTFNMCVGAAVGMGGMERGWLLGCVPA
jgi:hypothetical protein